jgi:hypothetical protein
MMLISLAPGTPGRRFYLCFGLAPETLGRCLLILIFTWMTTMMLLDADPAATGAAAAALPPPIAGGRPRLAAARAAAVAPYRAALGGHEYVALCHYGDVRMAALEEVRRAIPGDEASVGFGG